MHSRDPEGYYALLEVPFDANAARIKQAYRRRAMDLHPDRNPGRDTTAQFQRLNAAFAVLSDPDKRASYDAPLRRAAPPPAPVPAVVKCSRCGKISAQPRMVVFRAVKSAVLITWRTPIAGVFCSDCARRQGLKATAITLLLGWWSLPWGPIYSLQALLDNLLGGTQPPLENARLLAWQAYSFHQQGRADIAYAIAREALYFCAKVKATSRQAARAADRDDLAQRLKVFIGDAPAGLKLKNTWGLWHRFLPLHLAALALVAVGITWAVNALPLRYGSTDEPAPAAYTRPATAPNGQPWPSAAGYLSGEAQRYSGGRSEVIIDNRGNPAAVLVRLLAVPGDDTLPARQVYVPAYGFFTVNTLAAGRYQADYQDLNTGKRARSAVMELRETRTGERVQYSVVTLTLHAARLTPGR